MDKFRWVIAEDGISDLSMLSLLINYRKNEKKTTVDGKLCRINEYEVSENVYKAMRTLIQRALKPTAFSCLYGEEQIIVLFNKKHFRINRGDKEITDLALGYGELQGIDKAELEAALNEE